jgi:hypothetical protein
MIIKCRCGKEVDVDTADRYWDHLSYDDGWDYTDLSMDYAKLIFKIHEKIEEFHDEMNKRPLDSEDAFRFAWARNVVKSLLENEK